MRISFEIFPPKPGEPTDALWAALDPIAALAPAYISVTYGAGGTTQDRSLDTVRHLATTSSMPAAGHLTCVSRSREEVDQAVHDYLDAGASRIVALRGDPPGGPGTAFAPHPRGYASGAELVAGIRRFSDVAISVSAYPEGHPEARSRASDLDALAAKVDAGASEALTQFFFDNDDYLRYVARAQARGIEIPIVAGIMPIQDFTQLSRFAARCGARIPERIARRFDGLDHDESTRRLVAANVAAEQVLGLVEAGITDFHFYTMNRPDLAYSLCRLLDLHPGRRAMSSISTFAPTGSVATPTVVRAGNGAENFVA